MFTLRIQINLLIIGIFLSTSCSTNSEIKNEKNESTKNLFGTIEEKIKNEEDPNCFNESCTQIKISYPTFSLSPKISRFCEKLITKQLSYYTKSSGSAAIDELTQSIFNDYYTFLEDFPESKTPWNITLLLTTTYTSEKLICLKLTENSYTGGAHSTEMVYFKIINPEGELLATEDWITDMDQLKIIAESEFKKKLNISKNESFADRGFQFENNQFQLPESIGLTASDIIIYYNKYEIGTYADGSIEIKIPIKTMDAIIAI